MKFEHGVTIEKLSKNWLVKWWRLQMTKVWSIEVRKITPIADSKKEEK